MLYAGQAAAQPTNLAPFEWDVIAGTTAIMAAVPANPTRKALIVCNAGVGGTVVYVTFGQHSSPALNVGVPLAGGAVINSCLNLLPFASSNVAMGAQLNVIASAAGTPVVVLEF
jgi:hypothetical protein